MKKPLRTNAISLVLVLGTCSIGMLYTLFVMNVLSGSPPVRFVANTGLVFFSVFMMQVAQLSQPWLVLAIFGGVFVREGAATAVAGQPHCSPRGSHGHAQRPHGAAFAERESKAAAEVRPPGRNSVQDTAARCRQAERWRTVCSHPVERRHRGRARFGRSGAMVLFALRRRDLSRR